MNNVTELTSKADREKEAGLWIARIDRGLATDEREVLQKWLSAHPKNRQSFLETAELWDDMSAIAMLSEICPRSHNDAPAQRRYALPIAASVLVFVAASLWFALGDGLGTNFGGAGNSERWSTTYNTAVGEQRRLSLPDGSELVLNTDSLVSVNFTEINRLLTLERGEIHVVVAHDTSRPLSVLVGNRVIQAVGTEFNIEISSDQSIELVVTEGLVVIGVLDTPRHDVSADEPVALEQLSTLVAAGQEAVIQHAEETREQIEAEEIKTEEIAVKLSWRNGNLVFRGETLEEAMTEVGRYTAVEFIFLDEESKKEQVAGLFKAGDVDGLLAVLRRNFNISYEWDGEDTVYLSGQ